MVTLLGSVFGCCLAQLAVYKYGRFSGPAYAAWYHALVVIFALVDHILSGDELIKTGLVVYAVTCSVFLIILALEKQNDLDREQAALESTEAALHESQR